MSAQNLSACLDDKSNCIFPPSSFKVSIEGAWFLVSLSCWEMLHVVFKPYFSLVICWPDVWLPSGLQQLIVAYFVLISVCFTFTCILSLSLQLGWFALAPGTPGWSLPRVKACVCMTNSLFLSFFFFPLWSLIPPKCFVIPSPMSW